MNGQLAGCRTGRHVLSIDSLEALHSKSLPFPTDTINVNSIQVKEYISSVFRNLIWNNPLELISLWERLEVFFLPNLALFCYIMLNLGQMRVNVMLLSVLVNGPFFFQANVLSRDIS